MGEFGRFVCSRDDRLPAAPDARPKDTIVTTSSTQTLQEQDRASILHPFTALKQFAAGDLGGPRIVTGGQGIRIRDRDGNELIDAFAGLYCVNIGYGRQEVADAIHREASRLAYYHAYAGHSNEPVIELSRRVLAMAPQNMRRIYYGSSGSDANETQVKIVWYYNNVLGRPRKKKIISRWRGYHGGTVMSGSLTGLEVFHRAFDLPVAPVLHTTTPHYYWNAQPGMTEREFSARCARDLEALIQREGAETIAAFIAEPVLGTGGLIPPPQSYWQEIQPILRRHEILLIADEVICGFGRLGHAFGSNAYGIEPDLITVAKGLTSAYLPLSGAIIGEKVWQVLEQGSDEYGPFAHGYTYSAHPLCAAAGVANLQILERERIVEHVARTGPYLLSKLKEAFEGRPYVAEVRGAGMLAAVEFAKDPVRRERFDPALKVGAQLAAACIEEGVISRAMPHGDILGFAPPLVITREQIDDVVARVRRAVDRVTGKL
jgi:L-2,4-diaminobutyrate transaminase